MLQHQALFRKYGWSKGNYIFAGYRYKQRVYDMDEYSSKGSSVHPVKKYHGLLAAEHAAIEAPDMAAVAERTCVCV